MSSSSRKKAPTPPPPISKQPKRSSRVDEIPVEPGRVNEVRTTITELADFGLAHKLQQEEYDKHFQQNRSTNQIARVDVPLANMLKSKEVKELQEKRLTELELMKEVIEADEKMARELQVEEDKKAASSSLLHNSVDEKDDDEVLAKILQDEELSISLTQPATVNLQSPRKNSIDEDAILAQQLLEEERNAFRQEQIEMRSSGSSIGLRSSSGHSIGRQSNSSSHSSIPPASVVHSQVSLDESAARQLQYNHAKEVHKLTKQLQKMGYSHEQIEAIRGGHPVGNDPKASTTSAKSSSTNNGVYEPNLAVSTGGQSKSAKKDHRPSIKPPSAVVRTPSIIDPNRNETVPIRNSQQSVSSPVYHDASSNQPPQCSRDDNDDEVYDSLYEIPTPPRKTTSPSTAASSIARRLPSLPVREKQTKAKKLMSYFVNS